jgi:RNA polymerase sigma-70 factor (ECF subfamily)
MDDGSGSKSTVTPISATRAKLGRQLVTIYSNVVNEGVPNSLTGILRSLECSEGQGGNRGKTRMKVLTGHKPMPDLMLAAMPSLRAFAVSLIGNVDRADGLVRETLLQAWANPHSFKPGNNVSAWLFTILRDMFRSENRKSRREVEDIDGSYAEEDFRAALKQLPTDQRESLILIGASGFSYEETAQICGCAVGTIKSRVHRARIRLAEILSIESARDFEPDQFRGRVGTAVEDARRTAARKKATHARLR